MAEPAPSNQPPTAEELVALADSISQQINQSLGEQTQTLATTLTSVRSSVADVELLLATLDSSIDELLSRKTSTAEEKRLLEEEVERMKQSRSSIKEALDRLKATYDTGISNVQQATDAYTDINGNIDNALKNRVNTLITKIQDAVGLQQNPSNAAAPRPPVQGGSKHRRITHNRGRRHHRRTHKSNGGAKKRHTKRAINGGYIWGKRSSSASSKSRRSKKHSRK